ncbi:hypothetical protein GCN78_12960 [Janthinobacterium rivuli]|nr:hypothetical protein GCN78_12960 [Janthinobacterium sp. FT68W]
MVTRRSQETIVDTTLIAAPSSTRNKEAKRDTGKCKARAILSLALMCWTESPSRTRATCLSTSNASKSGRCLTNLLASNGRYAKTA